MEPYEEEVYNFLTQIDNYRASKQLASQLPQVEDQLKSEFWNSVVRNLKNQIQDPNWLIECEYPNWLFIRYKNATDLGIKYDQLSNKPDYGVFAPDNLFNREAVMAIISDLILQEGGNKNRPTPGWPFFKPLKYDFRQQDVIENILPINRQIMIEEVSGLLYEFYEKYSKVIERIASETVKP